MDIYPLAQHPEKAEICAAWSYGSWGYHSEERTIYKSIEEFKKRINHVNNIPMTWIGMKNKNIVGMISLVKNDHDERKDLSPWLASMFVHPDYRGQGYATKLIQHLHQEAKKLGFKKLYLYTPSAAKLYERNNWHIIGKVKDPRGFNEFDHLMEIELEHV